ncbi:MAG TPA: phosphatidylserine/phosphatidylglycerophosphate/cardiolipin synthase family protein [Patescibacteria group bacterium]|nr:phosphatidylserine/phosphatidylglycerophosphate/cardiolipin synthase family protein [Patescibacteria group bacterium]
MSKLQTAEDFFTDFTSYVRCAKKSIRIQTMNFEVGERMDILEPLLIDAAKRGVKVEIYCDWVAQKFIQGDLPLLPILLSKKKDIVKVHRRNTEMRRRLQRYGVVIRVTNIPSILTSWFPAFGRDHKKIYIIDNKIAWIGGINIFDEAFHNIDIMVRFTDSDIVNSLLKIYGAKNYSHEYNINDKYSLYIDSGQVGKSIIYDNAIKAVRSANKKIVFISQFVPDGHLLNNLICATKRNIEVTVITSSREDRKFNRYPEKFTYHFFKRRLSKHPNIRFIHLNNRVHAKLLLVDDSVAFVGSHNFTFMGILMGTEEITVKTIDPDLIKQLKLFIDKIVHL